MRIDTAINDLGKAIEKLSDELKVTRKCITAVAELLESGKIDNDCAAASLRKIVDDLPGGGE